MQNRVKIRFPSAEALDAARAMETPALVAKVVNEKRRYISVEATPAGAAQSFEAAVAEAQSSTETIAREFGAEIVEDVQYDMEAGMGSGVLVDAAIEAPSASLDEVLALIRAPQAWQQSRGAGVTIAIVDTGVDGNHPEFPPAKRAGSWEPVGEMPWTDWDGHGTMCACIATATRANGGRYDGVAPDAKLMACKTRFFDSELAAVYDALTARAQAGEVIVASNSFGRQTGAAPTPDPNSDFLPALDDAVAAGVIVFFSAGNNHNLAGGHPSRCSPTSVWLHKSREDVAAVATCDLQRAMWFYSSRGPGQFFGGAGTNRKPDFTAPTPQNGRILYGPGERVLANGWGTSGACPQGAGLAAVLLSINPGLGRVRVFDAVRNSAVDLGFAHECQGRGLINCEAAALQLANV